MSTTTCLSGLRIHVRPVVQGNSLINPQELLKPLEPICSASWSGIEPTGKYTADPPEQLWLTGLNHHIIQQLSNYLSRNKTSNQSEYTDAVVRLIRLRGRCALLKANVKLK